nr:uncharacterized protein LOC107382745 [Nothobranchius furzeri]
MPHCAAFGCNFQSKGNKGTGVSLHSFPTDKKRRKQWEDACGRTQLPKDPRLCSRHFSPGAFEAYSRPRLLKELTGAAGYERRLQLNALPTVFPHKEPKLPRKEREMRAKNHKNRHRPETLAAVLSRHPAPAAAASGEPSDTPLVTDEAQNSPLPSLSVATQYSNCTDAATQTDSDTPDAAAQWSADVQRVVTGEHAYAEKRGLDQQEEEDTGCLGLFSSGDECSESSQPLHKNPDPEYILSSSEPSQSSQGSHASTATEGDRVFLVFEEKLKQLLQHCLKCGSLIAPEDVKELQKEGSPLTLELTCAKGCSDRWQPQPTLSGTKGKGCLPRWGACW